MDLNKKLAIWTIILCGLVEIFITMVIITMPKEAIIIQELPPLALG